jgi:hypothetical protein
MTEPHDNTDSRPISVAELLARSGSIGAPPPGGRRRRRRGNADAVTVAELTGEIPVVNTGEIPAVEDEEHIDRGGPADTAPTNGTASRIAEPHYDEPHYDEPHYDEPAPRAVDYGADYEPEYDEYLDSIRGPARRPRWSAAEEMRPDPVYADDDDHHDIAVEEPLAAEEPPAAEAEDLPSYLRAEREHLFGGHSRDLSSHGDTEVIAAATADEDAAPQTTAQTVLRGGLIVLQSIIAVAFGAGLFMAFDELWKWNNIVALVLSVLVILALVVGVRIVRKTEDIGSTLIAVAVGALVTLGPLALLQSG